MDKGGVVPDLHIDGQLRMMDVQVSQYVGGELDELYPNLTVDVHHPELTVYV